MDKEDQLKEAISKHFTCCFVRDQDGRFYQVPKDSAIYAADKIIATVRGAQEHPAHPAIPEEVRDTITGGLNMAEREADIEHDPNWQADIKAARAYLAKCPQATDKAVCPKCGSTSYLSPDHNARCPQCKEWFGVEVMIVSPPRAPKVTP